jgi:hypothetical protein
MNEIHPSLRFLAVRANRGKVRKGHDSSEERCFCVIPNPRGSLNDQAKKNLLQARHSSVRPCNPAAPQDQTEALAAGDTSFVTGFLGLTVCDGITYFCLLKWDIWEL